MNFKFSYKVSRPEGKLGDYSVFTLTVENNTLTVTKEEEINTVKNNCSLGWSWKDSTFNLFINTVNKFLNNNTVYIEGKPLKKNYKPLSFKCKNMFNTYFAKPDIILQKDRVLFFEYDSFFGHSILSSIKIVNYEDITEGYYRYINMRDDENIPIRKYLPDWEELITIY